MIHLFFKPYFIQIVTRVIQSTALSQCIHSQTQKIIALTHMIDTPSLEPCARLSWYIFGECPTSASWEICFFPYFTPTYLLKNTCLIAYHDFFLSCACDLDVIEFWGQHPEALALLNISQIETRELFLNILILVGKKNGFLHANCENS